jgi:hypothetical protein
MKYLHLYNDGTYSQTDKDPSKEEMGAVAEGTLEVIRYETDRGFCTLRVEGDGEEGYQEADWERADVL